MLVSTKNKHFIRTISFSLAAVVIIAGAGISGFALASRYKTTIEYTYHRALNQLADYISTIESTLTKGTYANTSTQQYGLASKLMVNSEGAKNALSQLPLKEDESQALQKYLAQVGDFSTYAIGRLARGKNLSDDDMKSVDTLLGYAKKVNPLIEELSAYYGGNNELISERKELDEDITKEQGEVQQMNFSNTFVDLNENFVDYPSLIYDGPFADQVQQKRPRLTENADAFSADEAKQKASEFLNISVNDLEYKETRKGNIPVYVFTNETIYITVTVKGGYISEMYDKSEETQTANLNHDVITQKAEDFLKRQKLNSMHESYFVIVNDVYTINYAYRDESSKAVCYSDLIKVGVSQRTGKIVTYNATGYIMNHTNREIDSPQSSLEEAKQAVSEKLSIESSDLALIPSGGSKEVLCYEFTCKGQKNENVIVYINCETKLEEEIFILLQSDGGTLVM